MATRTTTRGAKGRSRARKNKKKVARPARIGGVLRRIRQRMGSPTDDVWGVVLLVVAVLTALALVGLAGPLGRVVAGSLRLLVGLWAFVLPVALAYVGLVLLGAVTRPDHGRTIFGVAIVFAASLTMFHLLTGTLPLAGNLDRLGMHGGIVGSLIAFPLRRLMGLWGELVVLLAVLTVGVLALTGATFRDLMRDVGRGLRALGGQMLRFRTWVGLTLERSTIGAPKLVVGAAGAGPSPAAPIAPPPEAPQERPTSKKKRTPGAKQARAVPPSPSGGGYALPPVELLSVTEGSATNRRSLERTAADLQEALRQHGVDARLTRIVPGPTVTRYEIELAPGVKVSKVTNLSHDIAYALASTDVRILAPIPGRSAIGIEVPNRQRRLVTLGDILRSDAAAEDRDPMLVALGKDVSGRPRLLRLTELPHVLIAGATGAGKSSCINAIITSLLMRATPEEVRLILVDPKRVELGQYNDVPHLLTRVITNPKKAADALQWAVQEMDRRYDLLADAGVRDVVSYREKYDAGGLDEDRFDRFPYIVAVVDELNDLMMVAGRSVEDSIVRIAQMARAVGIHLVLATQRPSVNVITGVIKANIPSRLAFSVASQTDSRVIIDQAGAEKLVGLGDMLVVTARDPKPERIQGAFVSEAEVHAVVDFVRTQREARYKDGEVFEAAAQQAEVAEEYEGEDPTIVREAIELVVRSQLGSTSMLQRKLRIGFARAGRVMDILERKGIVGPSIGSKARAVLVTEEELPQILS